MQMNMLAKYFGWNSELVPWTGCGVVLRGGWVADEPSVRFHLKRESHPLFFSLFVRLCVSIHFKFLWIGSTHSVNQSHFHRNILLGKKVDNPAGQMELVADKDRCRGTEMSPFRVPKGGGGLQSNNPRLRILLPLKACHYGTPTFRDGRRR